VILLSLGVSSSHAQGLGPVRQSSRQSSLDLSATVQINEIDASSRVHLERVQQFLDVEQWSEAVTALRRVMDRDGDQLIAVSGIRDRPLVRYIPMRQYGQWFMSRWHETAPQALAQYRREVDPIAQKWYEEGVERNDEEQLRNVVRHFFVSSSGDDALLQLGEYALERGDYSLARYYWEQIHPFSRHQEFAPRRDHGASERESAVARGRPRWSAGREAGGASQRSTPPEAHRTSQESASTSSWLAYPDSPLPLPDVQARLTLVSILEGDWGRAEYELEQLRGEAPEVEGVISGRQGPYVELLDEILREARTWEQRSGAEVTTFGLTNRRIPDVPSGTRATADFEELDIQGPPLWRNSLPRVNGRQDVRTRRRIPVGETIQETLSYHPIVVGSAVWVAQADAIRAFDVATGRPLVAGDREVHRSEEHATSPRRGILYEAGGPGSEVMLGRGGQWGTPRFTLTASEGRLFARMGTPITRWRNVDNLPRDQRSFLVGLDLSAEGRLLRGFPLHFDGTEWSFEGAPLVRGNYLWVAVRRQDEVRVESHVACFEVTTGRLAWRTKICDAETPGEGLVNELSHSLVTLDHDTLYFNTHLGVVCALEARTGDLRWLITYPRASFPPRDPDDGALHHFRDLTPSTVYRGVLLLAPSDSRQIFAVEGASGQLLWTLPPGIATDAKHVLGVSGDCWLVSGDYLYWIDVDRGHLVTQFPPPGRQVPGYAAGTPRGFGRGLLHGDRVYWPTQDKIFVFWQQPHGPRGRRQPRMARAPIDLRMHGAESGNLVVAPGLLLIATADELIALRASGYGPPASQDEFE
jgi:outer membrane protein assembly factor BamB